MGKNSLVELAEEAAKDTASIISDDLKALATQHGWDSEAVDAIKVNYSNGDFSIDVEPEQENKVMTLEYGTETTSPTAVFRKYGSNTKDAEKFFIKNLSSKVGVSL
jgi:hypothetical protein